MDAAKKHESYRQSLQDLAAVLEGECDRIAIMATINSVLKHNLPHYFWVGFYLVKDDALIVGPYQGTMGCLHIAFGKGICGTSAAEGRTLMVEDVHAFPGHIACDAQSRSEIAVPVHDGEGKLLAVFDVDSTESAAFDEIDRRYLETIVQTYFSRAEVLLTG